MTVSPRPTLPTQRPAELRAAADRLTARAQDLLEEADGLPDVERRAQRAHAYQLRTAAAVRRSQAHAIEHRGDTPAGRTVSVDDLTLAERYALAVGLQQILGGDE